MPHLKKYLKLGSDSGHTPLPSRYSFLPNQNGEDCVLINAAEFTYEYFQLLVNNKPKKAYKKFYKLKVAYDECQKRCAEVQAKYTADLECKNQKIADLEMQLKEMTERSSGQGAIIGTTMSSGVTQSGGTYSGSITTSSGHVRQGDDLAGKLHIPACIALEQLAKIKVDSRNQHPFNLIFCGNANVEIQVYTPAS
ncbi:hypothetical protein M441DRAFT_49782 [Trichoderma asperellum CBS 433.97]|uniref:Uncharacterized protein n=1 Tax=Trichoderma asperellum (strain ATCC 204424 / CBS 433.97 / NBRC 101777) TaxID=1042311 RepID=A0A2T3Z0J6_TRIA4|nr:hypothetical protein M441DRAFT_49782 [Trichoderma asperellum CBS 433.97]PTB38328.1 hypothetical protein M441DRAFT_49782 [Trichoderma asperellum CBS 433.97]